MNVTVNGTDYSSLERCTLDLLVEGGTGGGDWVLQKVRNNSMAIGRLLDWLADTKQISAEDASRIVADDPYVIQFGSKQD